MDDETRDSTDEQETWVRWRRQPAEAEVQSAQNGQGQETNEPSMPLQPTPASPPTTPPVAAEALRSSDVPGVPLPDVGSTSLAPLPSDVEQESSAAVADLMTRFQHAALRATTGELSTSPPPEPVPEERGSISIPPHLVRVFLEEAAEDLENMRAQLLEAEQVENPAAYHRALRQLAHKVKGSAGLYHYTQIADVAMAVEEWLQRAGDANAAEQERVHWRVTEGIALLDVLLTAANQGRTVDAPLSTRVENFVGEVRDEGQAAHPSALHVRETPDLSEAQPHATQPDEAGAPAEPHRPTPSHDVASDEYGPDREAQAQVSSEHELTLHVPSWQIDRLVTRLSEVAITRALGATVRAALSALDGELRRTRDRLNAQTAVISSAYLHAPFPQGSSEEAGVSDEESETDLAVRSLRETVADLGAHVHQFGALLDALAHAAREQDDLLRTIREQAVQMRMVPFSTLETRLQVAARLRAAENGKDVALLLACGDLQVDREVVDALADPLTQLVTNAVVHAIETPEERVRVGKPARGQIRIEARLRGSEIYLAVADDGQGSDPRVLVSAALHQHLLTVEQARLLTPAQALNLMFEPGLTTEETAGLMSGRGMGLDQVSTTVRALRGQISVESRVGHGTIFHMRLPVSQTLLTVLEVVCSGEHYAIPLSALSSVLLLTRSDPQLVDAPRYGNALSLEERRTLIQRLAAQSRGEATDEAALRDLRVFSLASMIEQRRPHGDANVAMLLEVDGSVAAILVDAVLGEREVVVRPLQPVLRRPSVWGAAVTPDGDMLMLLDLPTLVREVSSRPGTSGGARSWAGWGAPPQPSAQPEIRRQARVLVVDDSRTIRHNVREILAQAGHDTVEARDGVEAIGQLAALPFDVIVLDIDMPELNGLGLLEILRSNPHLAPVPVIVLTSSNTGEVRRRAHELGVLVFLGKPCPPEHLVNAVRRLTAR